MRNVTVAIGLLVIVLTAGLLIALLVSPPPGRYVAASHASLTPIVPPAPAVDKDGTNQSGDASLLNVVPIVGGNSPAEPREVAAVPMLKPHAQIIAEERTRTAQVPLEPEHLAILIKLGEDSIATGDFVSARLLLQRAAEAGNARAALMLAGTYDSNILDRSRARGLAGDVGKARFWYEKAVELGSTDASARLEVLSRRAH